jgi:hypothetical protein
LTLSSRAHRFSVVAVVSAIVLIALLLILHLNKGVFTYVIDDPYIHLVLARSLAAGHYGFNAGESSSPSSSILFPFVLVPFVTAGLGTVAPLIINIVALLITTYLLHRWLTDEMAATGFMASALTLTFVLTFSLVNMVFVGMEHSLQLLIGFIVCRGVSRIGSGLQAGWSFWAAVVIGPLIRYEMLAMSFSALAFTAWRTRRFGAPALAAAAVCLMVGGFGAFLVSRGLWWLPGSVMSKIPYLSQPGFSTLRTVRRFVTDFLGNADTQPGTLMAGLACLSIAGAMRRPDRTGYAVLAMLWLLAELLAGQVGWYRRYELWAVTSISLMAVATWAPLKETIGSLRPVPLTAAAMCLLIATSPYLVLLERIPTGANNIYNQQYQMGLFVQRLGVRSIAVNDVGLIGWMNPGVYVFDVIGLASPETLAHRRCCPDDAEWMDEMARRHGVQLILIYDSWVPARPASWTKIGELRLAGKLVTPAFSVVSIYGANSAVATDLAPKLAALAPNLPPEATLSFTPSAQTLSQ